MVGDADEALRRRVVVPAFDAALPRLPAGRALQTQQIDRVADAGTHAPRPVPARTHSGRAAACPGSAST